jgi:hypothetical protein
MAFLLDLVSIYVRPNKSLHATAYRAAFGGV